MPISPNNPLLDVLVTAVNAVAGTPAGSKVHAPSPVRGRLMECGFMPNSIVTSAMTLSLAISSPTSSTASNFTQVVTSTLGSFTANNLYEGACASVVPASNVFLNQGDAIQWTCSGGQHSTVGATCYAIIRRG